MDVEEVGVNDCFVKAGNELMRTQVVLEADVFAFAEIAEYRRKLAFGKINDGLNYVADESAKLMWGRWNADRTAKVHSFVQVTFSQ